MGLPGSGYYTYPPEWELYDLQEDPEELRNVDDDPAYAPDPRRPERRLWREQARLGDAPHPSQPRPAGVDDVAPPASAPPAIGGLGAGGPRWG